MNEIQKQNILIVTIIIVVRFVPIWNNRNVRTSISVQNWCEAPTLNRSVLVPPLWATPIRRIRAMRRPPKCTTRRWPNVCVESRLVYIQFPNCLKKLNFHKADYNTLNLYFNNIDSVIYLYDIIDVGFISNRSQIDIAKNKKRLQTI